MRKHELSCDEYHAHRVPYCCSSICWCHELRDRPLNLKCICNYTGREHTEHLVTDEHCFQHGTFSEEEFSVLSLKNRLLYTRHRAPYFSTVEQETNWWMNKLIPEDV